MDLTTWAEALIGEFEAFPDDKDPARALELRDALVSLRMLLAEPRVGTNVVRLCDRRLDVPALDRVEPTEGRMPGWRH